MSLSLREKFKSEFVIKCLHDRQRRSSQGGCLLKEVQVECSTRKFWGLFSPPTPLCFSNVCISVKGEGGSLVLSSTGLAVRFPRLGVFYLAVLCKYNE